MTGFYTFYVWGPLLCAQFMFYDASRIRNSGTLKLVDFEQKKGNKYWFYFVFIVEENVRIKGRNNLNFLQNQLK